MPIFRNLKVGDDSLSVFLSKLFNGTLFAKHDANGKIIKGTEIPFDLRGEMGAGIELGRQAIPVIANDCIVRSFYFIRRFAVELKQKNIIKISDIPQLDWNKIKPWDNPTITRMLTVATGVFTAVDVTEAAMSEKLFLSVNYVGIGRFVIALGGEMKYFLKRRNVAAIKKMYEDIRRNTFTQTDNNIYKRMENTVDIDRFGLTAEQTEILYNLEMYKTINDMNTSSKKKDLKVEWLDEWKKYMESGFASFVGKDNAVLHWYTVNEIHQKVNENFPENTWFRLMLLEAMLFEPYYPLSLEKDKKGNDVPSEKYSDLKYDKDTGDEFLESFFTENFYQKDYIKRLRKCYGKVTWELNDVLKSIIKTISITSVITLATVITAGTFAPAIAVALVGSNFAGLSGAALTSACLAYLGGGAVAAGGLGMAGGTAAIVGGGALLGLGVGSGVGGVVGVVGVKSKENTILQSAKLMVAVREIFLNDEHDIEYSDTVYEQYVESIKSIEHQLIEMKYRLDEPQGDEKKKLDEQIKNAEESVKAMQIAMKNMRRFNSSFAEGTSVEE